MSVNVLGTFLCYKYAGAQMIEQGKGGRIIGAASIASKQGLFLIMTQSNQFWKFSNDIGQGWPTLPIYSTSKFAVRGMTQNAGASTGNLLIIVC